MNPITKEWIDKAEGDFHTLYREMKAKKNKNYDAACFHAQQCAEKYLKAILCEVNIEFTKTHDLTILLDKILISEPLWEFLRKPLAYLTDFAVHYRYPGESADNDDAISAYNYCKLVRKHIKKALALK